MSSSAAATHFWAAADDALGGTSSAALAKWAVRLCSGHTATGHHRTMQVHMKTWLGLQHFEAQMTNADIAKQQPDLQFPNSNRNLIMGAASVTSEQLVSS